jgi:hypothetical protein
VCVWEGMGGKEGARRTSIHLDMRSIPAQSE